jgi:hypothetical protein
MWYSIRLEKRVDERGRIDEAAPSGWEICSGPHQNIAAAVTGLGKWIVKSRIGALGPRYIGVVYEVVRAYQLDDYGLTIPTKHLVQAPLAPWEGE